MTEKRMEKLCSNCAYHGDIYDVKGTARNWRGVDCLYPIPTWNYIALNTGSGMIDEKTARDCRCFKIAG